MNPSQPTTTELTVSRKLAASPGEVFDAWLDASRPGSPWFSVARAIVQPVVDGLFYHSVRFEEHDWAHYGRFMVLDRPRRIEHTWVSEATRGLESVLTLSIEPDGDQTLLSLRHAGLPDDEMGRRHQEGWAFVLDAMVERFAAPAARR